MPCLETFDRKSTPGWRNVTHVPDWWRCSCVPPEVFVRDLLPHEGNRLKRLSKTAKHAAKRERALICRASATTMSVPVIARLVGSDESHVRKVIHAFNETGFDSLDPDYRGGRPRRITEAQCERIVAVAGARPDSMGVPLAR